MNAAGFAGDGRRPLPVGEYELLLAAINAAGDSIIVYEKGEDGELYVGYANDAFYEQTGYEPPEVIGKPLNWFRRGMPDDCGMQEVREALEAGRAIKAEVCSYRKDGRSFWNQVTLEPIADARGEISHWISVERDVTAAIERESSLASQNARLVSLENAARDLVGTLDLPSLKSRFASAVRDLLNADGRIASLAVELPPDPLIARAAAENGTVRDGQTRIALPAGTAHIAEVRAQHPLGPGDVLIIELLAQYFAVAARNAALVSEIEDQRNAVLELNQIKTDLIAMLAHDFKGPLTNILGYTDLTAEMGDVNEHQQEYLNAIRRAALRLTDLAAHTLSLSRLERNEIDLVREHVDLRELLRDVAAASGGRVVDLDIRTDAAVAGDERRLRQVFYNLVENAIKYSREGAPVTLRARASDTHARVDVIDRGIGIPSAEVARVFDRFARASNARRLRIPGTGFGLFLAQQIVEMHGGTIDVVSTEGQGSTFTVMLPIAGSKHAARPLRVAVLEGKNESRSFITHALREAGLRTRLLPSLNALLESDMFQTDRIVIDFDALELSAEDCARLEHFAHAHKAHIVVVASEPPVLGANASVLCKPYLMRDLVALVQDGTPARSPAE